MENEWVHWSVQQRQYTVWRHCSGEVYELIIFWCDISSGFCALKLFKSVHFSPSYSKYKRGGRFWDSSVVARNRSEWNDPPCTIVRTLRKTQTGDSVECISCKRERRQEAALSGMRIAQTHAQSGRRSSRDQYVTNSGAVRVNNVIFDPAKVRATSPARVDGNNARQSTRTISSRHKGRRSLLYRTASMNRYRVYGYRLYQMRTARVPIDRVSEWV